MQIFVRCDRTITIEIDLNDETVQTLKEKITEKTGVPDHLQVLVVCGRLLYQNDRFLSSYNLFEKETTVHMSLHLRGGKPVIYLYPPRVMEVKVKVDLCPVWTSTTNYPSPNGGESHITDWSITWKVYCLK